MKKVVLITYKYAFEVSPFIKELCSFWYNQYNSKIDIYTETLYRKTGLELIYANIYTVFKNRFIPRLLKKVKLEYAVKYFFSYLLEKKINDYELYFVVDFIALDILKKINVDLGKVVYISLESTDCIQGMRKKEAVELLEQCYMRIIASKERASGFNRYLGTNLTFDYFPISIRPRPRRKERDNTEKVKLIYSGYIAEWSCLNELLDSISFELENDIEMLVIHGHSMGTRNYFKKIRKKISTSKKIIYNEEYYDDIDHHKLLSENDIGIAFYNNLSDTVNFDNLILSSGKISSYMWAGLAILTNIKCHLTQAAPFLLVEDIDDRQELMKLIAKFIKNRQQYKKAAYDMADKYYNFERYVKSITEKIDNI